MLFKACNTIGIRIKFEGVDGEHVTSDKKI